MGEPLSPEGYAATGGHVCPVCGGRDLYRHAPQFQHASMLQRVQCENCAATWKAVYDISGYEQLQPPTKEDTP